MKNKLSKKRLIFLLLIPILVISDIFICLCLYFFEPVDYTAPDFSETSYSFELYEKFNYDKNPDFYIKQITVDDVVSYEKDFRLKYIDNTILIIADKLSTSADISSLISANNGKICGYISPLNLYQIEFPDFDYEELSNICSLYSESDFVIATCVDYFEETPVSLEEASAYNYSDTFENDYKSIINYPNELKYDKGVVIGIFDSLVDNANRYLNVINGDTYNNEWLYESQYADFISHGTHIAGIACSSSDSDSPAVYPDGVIVSDNAFNNSISYWIASITDMLVNQNAKVINVSMGYNSYISLSANLGCENAISFIENESFFFEKFLEKLIDDNYEFVLCLAAGNESGDSINKVPSHYFSYGKKKYLDKLDLFDIFTERVKIADAKYSLPFTYIDNKKVNEHIIVVGSCDNNKRLSLFSNAGHNVDIVAPGEFIYSFSLNEEYEYSSGTSMATPFVTGTVALMFSIDDSLSASEIKHILINSATETVVGYGCEYPLLNVSEAVSVVENH